MSILANTMRSFLAASAVMAFATDAQAQTSIPQGSNEVRADFFAKCAANSDIVPAFPQFFPPFNARISPAVH